MNRQELLNLMQFVCDQNSNVFFETVKEQNFELSDKQIRAMIQALEAKTKDSFMRFAERM